MHRWLGTRTYLGLIDLVVLAAIFFGWPIYWSNSMDVVVSEPFAQELAFGPEENISMLLYQLLWLITGLSYLAFRRFDWTPLLRGMSWMTPLEALGVFVLMSASFDLSLSLLCLVQGQVPTFSSWDELRQSWGQIDGTLLLYSAFNGFYEEFFFLGLCLSVPRRHLALALLLSVCVRIAFHTYLGVLSAFAIGLMGLLMALAYLRWRQLWPFCLGHALADVLGLGLPYPA
ncbi:CPBP family intramembrane glutamic endopeptidase [Metapseudomonas otitidis]|uniref:CPBP family intramembrane glutamic endopeptidase n=1 Tax=Metapseudomonas otitidis TaxID=319939 RepID=UPI0013F5E219|nr:CPBP family intramembrane glutamic endopeptidase [Pseudomonas otitidis]